MGKLILKNNGLETQLINGEDFTTLTPQANTYFVGIDAVNGSLEKLDPAGNIVDYDSNTGGGGTFTGGTVIGATEFLDGLTANTITVDVISAATYLNIPGGSSLYEVGSGIDSTQRCGVGSDASGDYSVVVGGQNIRL
jgi:hypothetical protein